MPQSLTTKKALWRKRHPAKAKAARARDNENRNKRYAATGSQNGKVTCGVSGCNRAAQMSHQGGTIKKRCATHHLAVEKKNGTGPHKKGKDSGPGKGMKMRKKA